ncbi:MAG TPA: choice-of-anchor D domain-containing protein [Candidatus Acidoferrales bacterium]|nr:choice-of-anchor D domain-containing protein [Candidatus Acidoferrales bacterium]
MILSVAGISGCGVGDGLPSGALKVSSASVDFGQVAVGSQATETVKLTNAGTAPIELSQVLLSGTGFKVLGSGLAGSLEVGRSVAVEIQFAPNTTGDTAGTFSIVSNAKNSPTNIHVTGKGAKASVAGLSANPSAISFGNVQVGGTAKQVVTVTNSGTANENLTTVSAAGAGFSVSGISLPVSLGAGQSTTFTAQFAPAATSGSTGSISIGATSNNSNPTISVALSGTGTQAQIAVKPGSVDFGSVTTGTSSSQAITISNAGSASLTVSQFAVSGTGFSTTGLTTPLTIPAGGSSTFSAVFKPTSTAASSGAITLFSDAAASQVTVGLAGQGSAAGTAALTINPATVSFGGVAVGTTAKQVVTVTNSGTASESVTGVSASGTGFSVTGITLPVSLSAGQSTTFTAQFTPTNTNNASGSIAVAATSSGADPTFNVALSGTGTQAQIAANPASVSFGTVTTGNTNSQPVVISNPGNASLTISQFSVTGSGFSTTGLTAPVTIPAGGSATFNAVFKPASSSSVTGSISVVSNAPTSPTAISLSGTGGAATYSLSVSPSNLTFGTVAVGTSTSQNVTLTNTGNSNVTISSVGVTGNGFSGSGVNAGLILTPNQSAVLSVTFDPKASGSVTGSVTIASNAGNSPQSVSLSGSGSASHSVALSWMASTSSGVTGYNVYRGTVLGSYSKMNGSPVAQASYTDATVQGGTYYYVVTAVNSSNAESTYSDPATVVVP